MNELLKYRNQYGFLILELITPFMHVSNINIDKALETSFKELITISLHEAEQVALITDNKSIQIVNVFGEIDEAYILYHKSISVVSFANIVEIKFTSDLDPQDEIERIYQDTKKVEKLFLKDPQNIRDIEKRVEQRKKEEEPVSKGQHG